MTTAINSDALFKQPEYSILRQAMFFEDEIPQYDINIAEHNIDWNYLLTIAEQHGLTPLLYLFLKTQHHSAPTTILNQLRDRYSANTLRNRILTSELIDVLDLLSANNIPVLTYKGPALTLLAYEDLGHRQFGDLDILINPEHVQKAGDLLKQQQYQRAIPELTDRQEQDFIHTAHEHTFISPDQLVHIDLHWSPSNRRFPFKIKIGELFQHAQNYQWQSHNIKHVSVQDHLLLLCMHANKDLWRKLVWICDIDRLIRKNNDIDWDLLIKQAQQTHCKKMLYLALRISYDILNTPIPELVLESAIKIAPIKQGEKILKLSMKDYPSVKTYLQCMAIQPHILITCDTWTDRFCYITRSLITPTECDMLKINIPAYLHFIYYIVSPVRKILFCTTRGLKRLIFNRTEP